MVGELPCVRLVVRGGRDAEQLRATIDDAVPSVQKAKLRRYLDSPLSANSIVLLYRI